MTTPNTLSVHPCSSPTPGIVAEHTNFASGEPSGFGGVVGTYVYAAHGEMCFSCRRSLRLYVAQLLPACTISARLYFPRPRSRVADTVRNGCVHITSSGAWADTNCRANLDADGVLCRTAPTRVLVDSCDPKSCTPCQLYSGAKNDTVGGGRAGEDSYTSPNGWKLTVGTPTCEDLDTFPCSLYPP